jgi:hypothetical protein
MSKKDALVLISEAFTVKLGFMQQETGGKNRNVNND